jgi:flagellin-like hook-associated protein FlgL
MNSTIRRTNSGYSINLAYDDSAGIRHLQCTLGVDIICLPE